MTVPVNTLKFKFDISAYRLLGRELITDRITALFELVKNCYDANASNVDVEFFDVNRKSPYSKIIIKDDGMGMSYEDVERKWMVIGTNNKKKTERHLLHLIVESSGKKESEDLPSTNSVQSSF